MTALLDLAPTLMFLFFSHSFLLNKKVREKSFGSCTLAQLVDNLLGSERDSRSGAKDQRHTSLVEEVVILGWNDPTAHNQLVASTLLLQLLNQGRHKGFVAGSLA